MFDVYSKQSQSTLFYGFFLVSDIGVIIFSILDCTYFVIFWKKESLLLVEMVTDPDLTKLCPFDQFRPDPPHWFLPQL
jgi:hypothetical protein